MPLGANKAAIMGVAGASTGDVVLIQSQTASDSATISFTSGIDSTYGGYIFKFYNINAETDNTTFGFQVNVSGESGYNEAITSTVYRAYHDEADSAAALGYRTGDDQAQGTGFQQLTDDVPNDADQGFAGELHLFNPSSTTYVKNFYARVQNGHYANYSTDIYTAGYINVTGAVDDIQFKSSSGNFDGTIKMWGVKN